MFYDLLQAVAPPTVTPWTDTVRHYLGLFLPIILGGGAVPLMDGLKKLNSYIGEAPYWAQQILLILVACLLTVLANWLGISLPTSLNGMSQDTLNVMLTALIGHSINSARSKSKVANEVLPEGPVIVAQLPTTTTVKGA